MDGHVEAGYLREGNRVVGGGGDGLGEIGADLAGVDVEGGRELDVPHVVRAQPRAHEAGDEAVIGGGAVELDALNERRGAVADPDDGDANRAQ
jgi:hypothetical protein